MPSARARFIAVLLSAALVCAACADPVVPTVAAPATPTPVPEPTPTSEPTIADQPTPTPAPFEAEPGITADELRIGVIIDVGAGEVADQMSASAADAVQAWAEAVNESGGLAGRQVVVERIPTSPVLADHAEAIDVACNRDIFALVGSSALIDGDGLDRLAAADCALPDFPATVSSVERLESAVTFVSNPINGDVAAAGWARYYAENSPEAAANAGTMLLDVPVAIIGGSRTIEAATAQGFTFSFQPEVPFTTDFVAEAETLAAAAPGLLTWLSDGGRLIALLQQLEAIEADVPTVDCAQACYSRAWVEAAGPLGDGVSVWLPTTPLEEADVNSELTRYLFFLGSTVPGSVPTSVGVNAWASALLFEEAVRTAVGEDTADYDPASLTRQLVLDAAGGITVWDARGLHGPANPAEGVPSSCFVLLTLVNGAWERTFPERRGEFDCAAENLVRLTITTSLGEQAPVEEDPEPEPDEGE